MNTDSANPNDALSDTHNPSTQQPNPSSQQSGADSPASDSDAVPESSNPAIQQSNNPSIHDPSPSAADAARRNGKVARLPERVRELVNLMLCDGRTYAEISARIAQHGHNISASNLSRWHSGGYQVWIKEHAILDDLHTRLDFASDVVNKKRGNLIQEASLRIAVLRLFNLVLEFDPAVLKDQVAENPGAYARILNALCKLTSGAVACEKHRLDEEYRQRRQPVSPAALDTLLKSPI